MKGFVLFAVMLFTAATNADTFTKVDAGTLNSNFKGSTLYIPDHLATSSAGIMMLHGSTPYAFRSRDNNGLPELLATNGYLVFDLCWFECPGNPNFDAWAIFEHDLIKTYDALEWFRSLKTFSGKVGLFGFSRGAEHALLLNEFIMKDGLNPPIATAIQSSIPQVATSFSWRWISDMRPYLPFCWACKDGTENCHSATLQTFDILELRHIGFDIANSLFTWRTDICGPDPRILDLRHAHAYRWKGQPVADYWIWPKTPSGESIDSSGHQIDLTSYSGPYLILHGENDDIWPVDFSKENAQALKDFQEAGTGRRPIITKIILPDESTTLVKELTSTSILAGQYLDEKLWHQFYILQGADHVFRKKEHAKLRKKLVAEFFDLHLH